MQGGILVLTEHLKGEITEITYEMLGIGRKMADFLKVPLYPVVLGRNVSHLTSHLGIADRIFLVENPALDMPSPNVVASILKNVVKEKQISLVTIGGTNLSMGIGPKLSAFTAFPFINFCKNITFADTSILFTSQLFGGKILTDTRLPNNRGIISILPGSFPANAGKVEGSASVERLEIPLGEPEVIFRKFIEPEAGDVDITRQGILVAVGRGIQNQENISLAEELAGILRGAVCASRPVVDQGWLPLTRQVGKSGMTVKPKLYLALGISGAPEHQEGMRNSQLIIAVNTDPKAPIFDIAHYGAAMDIFEVIPALIEEARKRKGAG